jgi:hypothetical protein
MRRWMSTAKAVVREERKAVIGEEGEAVIGEQGEAVVGKEGGMESLVLPGSIAEDLMNLSPSRESIEPSRTTDHAARADFSD